MSREVRIAALEGGRALLSESEDENPDLAARILLELADALPLECYGAPGRIVQEARSYCAELLTDLRERGYG